MRASRKNHTPTLLNEVNHLPAAIGAGVHGYGRRISAQLRQYALVALLAWLSFLVINHFIVSTVQVTGFSMRPTLGDTDVHLLNRWLYLFRSPRPGDIVVIKDPTDNGYSIKRIVAGPGDFICLREGSVYVNGKILSEPYLKPATTTTINGSIDAQWMTGCGKGEYLVLGDNRDNSFDGRFYGPISRSRILGEVTP